MMMRNMKREALKELGFFIWCKCYKTRAYEYSDELDREHLSDKMKAGFPELEWERLWRAVKYILREEEID